MVKEHRMPEFCMPYGKTHLVARLPDPWQPTLVTPKRVVAAADPVGVVQRALDHPLEVKRLAAYRKIRTAAIAINDKTRPVPHNYLLPPLLAQLESAGLAPAAITLIIATGAHPPLSVDEYAAVVPPDVLARYPVLCHDANDRASMVNVGETTQGTPVWINRHFKQADLRLVVGNVEPHQFMGFSGGVKSAVIGLAGLETINHNHAMMTDARSRLGTFEHNPARQDVEQMGQMVGVHFALNAILNDSKQIVAALAGDPLAVMRAAVPVVRDLYQVAVPEPFDVIIASPGGYPKDINLYQSQKGLAHAALITKTGGTIILVAACPEGSGSQTYEKWLEGLNSYDDILERFGQEGFRIGPHKAYQIARDASRVRVLLVSQMPDDFVKRLLLTPVNSLAEGLARAVERLTPAARIGLLPYANATIPYLDQAY
jgi:nickel-dependent lactate racemase